MKNDEAIVAMVDSNLQREYISPSEKAHAYKMRYDVMKKKGNTNIRGRVVHKTKGKRTVEILAEEFGESTKQIQRYLKLTELIPELLTKLDDDQLSISAAFEIAFLKEEEQKWFLEAMDYAQATPSLSQAQRIKKLSQNNELTEDDLKDILYLPVKGLCQLIKTISMVKKRLNKKLKIEGIVLTMVDYRTNYAKDITQKLREGYESTIGVFNTYIPFSVKAAECSLEGVSIYIHEPKGKVAEAYKKLTEEVLSHEN